MATTLTRPTIRHETIDRKTKQSRTDISTSLLNQTQVAQSRNRSNAIAHRQLIICGGSPTDQRAFAESLTRPPLPQSLRRARNDNIEHADRGNLALSNRYAYGYGHLSLYSAQSPGLGTTALGQESEEVARLQCHCIPEADIAYETVLRRILVAKDIVEEDNDESVQAEIHKPAVYILLSWKEPWKFLRTLRAWVQLLAKAISPSLREDETLEVLRDHQISITVIVQHVEAQQELENEGWTEDRFDYVCQVLRTVLLPLHPRSALIYTPSILTPQQPGSTLSELQKVVFTALNLDLTALSPRPSSSGGGGNAVKKEELLPRHNVVDRMNLVIPGAWDSAGKVRLLTETFSPEDVLSAWSFDLSNSIFPTQIQPSKDVEHPAQAEQPSKRQNEEVFQAESPISPSPSLPPSPTKSSPSAVRTFESKILDPNAHKAIKSPTVTVIARPEQEFLKEMKTELDNYVAKDRERTAAVSASVSTARVLGMPTGESSGALDNLGNVSFNVGGVNYNDITAEAAIERLKRPLLGETQSPSSTGSRASTPRQPRRIDHDREGTPGSTTPGKADFPSEDLEKFFASMANKAGSGIASRQGTPSRQ